MKIEQENMSKKSELISEKEPGEAQNDSVFDFLYCDTDRLGSFLAQFDDSGHLEHVIQRRSAATEAKRGYKVNIGGGATVAGTGGSGMLGYERGPIDKGTEAIERAYNPLWANAREFLDALESRGLVEREPGKARIGGFLLVSGSLSVFDMSLLKSAWEQPFIRNILKTSLGDVEPPSMPLSRQQRRASQTVQKTPSQSVGDAVIGMLQLMPHAIVASVRFGSASVWCNLTEKNLVGASTDLLLKHGFRVAGHWNLLGIVDAFPDAPSDTENENVIADANALGSLGEMVAGFGPAMRSMLGRPLHAMGVTPLLIFRQISG